MSEKRNVPTFRLSRVHSAGQLEGPIVSPNRQTVAEHLGQVHELLREHGACLIYAKEWMYVPFHSIDTIARGKERFQLPWPLVDG